MTKKFLLDCLAKQAYQYREEPFDLKSGQKSNHYVDCRPLMLDHHMGAMASKLIAGHAAWSFEQVGFVAGVATGGCAPAMGVGRELGEVPVIFVRPEAKAHGSRSQLILPAGLKLHGPTKDRKRHGILVEDVITTGGSSLMAMGALEEAHFVVDAVYCLVNRSDKTKLVDAPIHALATLEEIIERATKREP